jgi:hypothetical protein
MGWTGLTLYKYASPRPRRALPYGVETFLNSWHLRPGTRSGNPIWKSRGPADVSNKAGSLEPGAPQADIRPGSQRF